MKIDRSVSNDVLYIEEESKASNNTKHGSAGGDRNNEPLEKEAKAELVL